jgi:predicted Zn-dependent peptidase
MSSRLFQEVREKLGLVYTISDMTQLFSDNGLMSIYAGTSPKNLELLVSTIAKELKKATHSITKEELDKTIVQIKAGRLMSLESTTARAQSNLSNILTYNKHIPFEETLAKYNAVTVFDVQDILAKIIKNNDITIATYGQVQAMPSISKVIDMFS